MSSNTSAGPLDLDTIARDAATAIAYRRYLVNEGGLSESSAIELTAAYIQACKIAAAVGEDDGADAPVPLPRGTRRSRLTLTE